MSHLPSLACLHFEPVSAPKRSLDDLHCSGEDGDPENAEEQSGNFTYRFTHNDGCVLTYSVRVMEFAIDFKIIGDGVFNFSIRRPFTKGISTASPWRMWKKQAGCPRTVPRAIRAVYHIVRQRFPRLTTLNYEDHAVVDQWDLRAYDAEVDERERRFEPSPRRAAVAAVVTRMYWRVRYYENIGFNFVNGNYNTIVTAATKKLHAAARGARSVSEERNLVDAAASDIPVAEPFRGDLLAIGARLSNETVCIEENANRV